MIERISAYHKKFFGGFDGLTFCFSSTYEYLFSGNDKIIERGISAGFKPVYLGGHRSSTHEAILQTCASDDSEEVNEILFSTLKVSAVRRTELICSSRCALLTSGTTWEGYFGRF